MVRTTERFVHERNVERFRELLRNCTEQKDRRILEELLAAELAKAKEMGWDRMLD